MKKLFTILAIAFTTVACQKNVSEILPAQQAEETSYTIPGGYQLPECIIPVETPLLAGQTTNVGSVTVWNDANNVYVSYLTTGTYLMKKTHLYAGACNGIPVNSSGNPQIGLFPYKNDHGSGVSSYVYTIPRSSLPAGCICIAAHAEIVAYNASGQIIYSQTAWGQGQQINNGGSWAMKFNYCPEDCDGPR